MPPLERRHPRVAAVTGAEHGRRGGHLVSDPASEMGDIGASLKLSSGQKKSSARHMRHRRLVKSPAEPRGGVGVDGKPMRRLSPKKNVILNTRNPFIIWLASNELQLSLSVMAIIHGCYWAGFEWPSLWIRMQHLATVADGVGTEASRYVRGIHDFKFVLYWVIQIIAIRSVLLHHVLPAIPRHFSIASARRQRRFCEMGWSVIYVATSWTIGFRVWKASPYYMSTANLYANYPEDHVLMPYGLKWFYLVQAAFWFSNIYTIHIEERRKDHYEMLTHHVATIVLVLLSYAFHFTRFGHVFMLVMDFPDLFLSLAKLFRYLGQEMVPNILFGVFTISWVVTKHYLCLKMMASIWTHGPPAIPLEKRFPHYPNSYASYPIVGFLWAFLCLLQGILIYWFYLITRVLYKVLVKGEGADDNRSDEEEESADE